MNLRKTANKLQTALCTQGRYFKINQYQSYSPKAERMVTKFVLIESIRDDEGKIGNVAILETYQMADVVKKLVEIYGGG